MCSGGACRANASVEQQSPGLSLTRARHRSRAISQRDPPPPPQRDPRVGIALVSAAADAALHAAAGVLQDRMCNDWVDVSAIFLLGRSDASVVCLLFTLLAGCGGGGSLLQDVRCWCPPRICLRL
ncbi:hypothetical protein EJB05_27079, partial [Eragrostis curvula]